jgi:hypothetical protein
MQNLNLLVSYRGYGSSSCFARGPVQEISLHLAKEARSKCKGRMTDSSLEGYAELFEEKLRENAELDGTHETILEAFSMNFEVGTNAGGCQNVTIPVTVQDIYEEDIPFGWRPQSGWHGRPDSEKFLFSNELDELKALKVLL